MSMSSTHDSDPQSGQSSWREFLSAEMGVSHLEAESFHDTKFDALKPSLVEAMYSNDPPTHEQEHAARERVDAIRAESQPLDRKIQEVRGQLRELNQQLNKLEGRRFALQEERDSCQLVLSPWRRLPTDILAEILQVAVNPESLSFLSKTNPGTDRDHFTALRGVCKLWRGAALSTHSLWTSAWVNLDCYKDDELPKAIRDIECYFQRSGPSLPLNIGFQWGQDRPIGPEGEEELWNIWLDFLRSFRGRWEEISFFTDVYHFQLFEGSLKKGVGLDKGPWKALFLQVVLEDTSSEPPILADPGVFNDLFPDLETINLNSASDLLITGNQSSSRLLDPHTTMRKLRLEVHSDLNPYFHKLGGFPNLKKLLFNCPKLNIVPVLVEGNAIELPRLELLLMACPPSFTVLSRLRTPSLKTLQLLTNVPPEPASPDSTASLQRDLMESFDHVIAFAEQCNQTLREMRINCWFLQTEYALLCLLGALSSVECLCIDTWFRPTEQSTAILDPRLTIVDDIRNSTYLSNLHKLCLHDPQDEETPLPAEWGSSELIPPLPFAEEGRDQSDGIRPVFSGASSGPTNSVGEAPRPSIMDEVGPLQAPREQTGPSSPPMPLPPPDAPVDISAEGGDTTDPFIRGTPSWHYLQWFLQSSSKRSQESGAEGEARTGSKAGKTFEFCFSGRALESGGVDARAVVRLLEREGLKFDREPSCRVYW